MEEKKFLREYDQLIAEWDWEKNKDISPNKLRKSSNRKVWWICKNGHSYPATVASRTGGGGCPYCSGRLAIEGENDLQTLYPEIAAQWHYEKNFPLLPTQVKPHSSKKVWWICEKGHEYDSVINNRTSGQGCPYCSNRKVLAGYNDLETINPQIAKQWNYEKNGTLDPNNFTSKVGRKVWWRCDKGHEWKATIESRTLGSGCPYCSGHKAIPGENDLLTLRPDIAAGWNYEKNAPLTPDKITAYSNKSVWWKCSKCQHEWKASPARRDKPYCKSCNYKLYGQQKIEKAAKRNNLAEKRPDIAKQWHPTKNGDLTPADVSCGSDKKVWWICDKGHEWQSSILNRVKDNLGCPYCGNKKVLVGYNDFPTFYPEIAKEWNYEKNVGLSPQNYVSGSVKTVWWKCKDCGHEWPAPISTRIRGGKCPACGKKNRNN